MRRGIACGLVVALTVSSLIGCNKEEIPTIVENPGAIEQNYDKDRGPGDPDNSSVDSKTEDRPKDEENSQQEIVMYVMNSGVEIFDAKDTSANRISNVKKGEQLILMEFDAEWAKVKLGEEKFGYIESKNITTSEVDKELAKPITTLDLGIKPIRKEEIPGNPRVKIQGIYVSKATADSKKLNTFLEAAETTNLNAFIIDFKSDDGILLFPTEIDKAKEYRADRLVNIKNPQAFMDALRDRDIYPIARIVVFKDPNLVVRRQDLGIRRLDGSLMEYNKNVYWSSPYSKEVWDYNIEIAKEAARYGFKEIQFDYVRFPESKSVTYPHSDGRHKAQVIKEFLEYARKELTPYNVYISADVFGLVTTDKEDMGIGQNWEAVSNAVDYIKPMTYPSHYGPGVYGFTIPDANPFGILDRAMQDANARNATLEYPAIIRPWLQDFTASYLGEGRFIKYGAKEVQAQIDAIRKNGIDEFILWNAGNNYNLDVFK